MSDFVFVEVLECRPVQQNSNVALLLITPQCQPDQSKLTRRRVCACTLFAGKKPVSSFLHDCDA
jgi:ferredoxin-thioredoxin reductase catalytic subunit